MRILTEQHLERIEEILGRALTPEERVESHQLKDIAVPVILIARKIAAESRQLAVKYLLELVPGTRLSLVTTFLEDVVEGGLSTSEWQIRRTDT